MKVKGEELGFKISHLQFILALDTSLINHYSLFK